MRTTLRIDDALLAEAKQVAARSGRTLTAVIEDALRESLRRPTVEHRDPFKLPTFRGGTGVQPGVDLDDSAGLLDVMEDRDRPA